MLFDKYKTSKEFKNDLILKYDENSVNASGHLASALILFKYMLLFIPDYISVEQEEDLIYSYLNGLSKNSPVKEKLNALQEDFVLNCNISIVNKSPSLFKESSFSKKNGLDVQIFALATIADSMIKENINNKHTYSDLHYDLCILFIKMYFEYMNGEKIKLNLNPNNIYMEEKSNLTKSESSGCFGFVLIFIFSFFYQLDYEMIFYAFNGFILKISSIII